ncbi:MAG: helix-turn-helix domain-containing protein [Candidatus Nezhaarchaeales archaeon]
MVRLTPLRREIAVRMLGEIAFSSDIGGALRLWRERFLTSKVDLARHLKLSPSVISDYESGRRRSPGVKVLKRFVLALMEIDEKRGERVLKDLAYLLVGSEPLRSAILDARNFTEAPSVFEFCKFIKARIFTCEDLWGDDVTGYVVLHSSKLLLETPAYDYVKLQSLIAGKAVVFADAPSSQPLMVSVKLMQAKPAVVVLHGLRSIDKTSRAIANSEQIPLATVRGFSTVDLIKALRSFKPGEQLFTSAK